MSGLPDYGYRFIVQGDRVFVVSGTGAADPVGRLWSLPRDGGSAQELASDLPRPRMIAADHDHVYIASEESTRPIARVARDGGPIETVLSTGHVINIAVADGRVYASTIRDHLIAIEPDTGQTTALVDDGLFGVGNLRVDGDYLYYVNSGRFGARIERVPRAGGEVELIAIGQRSPFDLAVRPGRVAWVLGEPSAILTRPTVEGPKAIWASTLARAMVRYGDHIYWAGGYAVAEYDLASGATRSLLTKFFVNISALAVDATDIYLVQPLDEEPQLGHFTPGAIYRMPRDGSSPPTRIASEQWTIGPIEADESYVYWVNRGPWPSFPGEIVRYEKATGAIQILASGQPGARGVALDDTQVYWFSAAGRALMTVPKTGGTPIPVVTQVGGNPTDLIREPDGTFYWSDRDGAVRAFREGAIVDIASGPFSPGQPVIDGGQLYFPARMGMDFRDVILTRPLEGGPLRMIAADQGYSSHLIVDAGRIYWLDEEAGLVFSAPVSGVAPVTVADNLGIATQLELTDDAVYWVGNGEIWRQRLASGPAERLVTATSGVGALAVIDDTLYWSAGDSVRCASLPR